MTIMIICFYFDCLWNIHSRSCKGTSSSLLDECIKVFVLVGINIQTVIHLLLAENLRQEGVKMFCIFIKDVFDSLLDVL